MKSLMIQNNFCYRADNMIRCNQETIIIYVTMYSFSNNNSTMKLHHTHYSWCSDTIWLPPFCVLSPPSSAPQTWRGFPRCCPGRYTGVPTAPPGTLGRSLGSGSRSGWSASPWGRGTVKIGEEAAWTSQTNTWTSTKLLTRGSPVNVRDWSIHSIFI